MSTPKSTDGLSRETAREFLVAALGEEHFKHTVVRVELGAKVIIFHCSCDASGEYRNNEHMGKRALEALRNVPRE